MRTRTRTIFTAIHDSAVSILLFSTLIFGSASVDFNFRKEVWLLVLQFRFRCFQSLSISLVFLFAIDFVFKFVFNSSFKLFDIRFLLFYGVLSGFWVFAFKHENLKITERLCWILDIKKQLKLLNFIFIFCAAIVVIVL